MSDEITSDQNTPDSLPDTPAGPPKLVAKPLRPLPVDEADGVLDEVQAWFLAQAERDGWVYTSVLRQLVNKMYRDRDYLEKRQTRGQHTPYDYAVDRDLKAVSWAIRAIVRYTPQDEKARPEPPKPARLPSRHLTPTQRKQFSGRPSWNGKPKRGWDGPDLPVRAEYPAPPLWAHPEDDLPDTSEMITEAPAPPADAQA